MPAGRYSRHRRRRSRSTVYSRSSRATAVARRAADDRRRGPRTADHRAGRMPRRARRVPRRERQPQNDLPPPVRVLSLSLVDNGTGRGETRLSSSVTISQPCARVLRGRATVARIGSKSRSRTQRRGTRIGVDHSPQVLDGPQCRPGKRLVDGKVVRRASDRRRERGRHRERRRHASAYAALCECIRPAHRVPAQPQSDEPAELVSDRPAWSSTRRSQMRSIPSLGVSSPAPRARRPPPPTAGRAVAARRLARLERGERAARRAARSSPRTRAPSPSTTASPARMLPWTAKPRDDGPAQSSHLRAGQAAASPRRVTTPSCRVSEPGRLRAPRRAPRRGGRPCSSSCRIARRRRRRRRPASRPRRRPPSPRARPSRRRSTSTARRSRPRRPRDPRRRSRTSLGARSCAHVTQPSRMRGSTHA